MKIIGALVIIFSLTMIGFQAASMFSNRPKEIRRIIIGLQVLETEICYGSTALPQALLHVAKRVRGNVGELFYLASGFLTHYDGLSTSDCWEMAIEKMWGKTVMKKPEKEILMHLGKVLGQSDRSDQQKHIRLAAINLQSEEEEARSDQKKYEKMCKSLGFLGGILAVILIY